MFVKPSATGSNGYFPSINVFTGTLGALNSINCGSETQGFSARSGTKYYSMVYSANYGAGGNLVFTLNGNPSLKVSVKVNATDLVDQKSGVATLQGTVTCSRPALVSVSGILQQPIGRVNIVTGGYNVNVANCSGATNWTATVTPTNGKYAGGSANATASAIGTDSVTGESASASTTANVQLNGKK
jgi:hypothetical protein